MSDQMPTAVPPSSPKRPLPVWALIAAVLALALLAVAVGWWVSSRAAGDRLAEAERRLDALESSATAQSEETPSQEPPGEAEQTAEDTPAEPGPSFTKYAYVRAMSGTAGAYTLSLDFFDIFTEGAAIDYANQHGITVPSNGILYANESQATEDLPLAGSAVIVYATGGVESLSMVPATPQGLKDWVAGDWDALPGSMTDMWRITVTEGVVTRVEMLVVAD